MHVVAAVSTGIRVRVGVVDGLAEWVLRDKDFIDARQTGALQLSVGYKLVCGRVQPQKFASAN